MKQQLTKSQKLGLKPEPALPSERLDSHPSSRGCLAQISRDDSNVLDHSTYIFG
jgi:hypothetical protein